MARISQGNALTSPLQQPGGKFADDGYGLITSRLIDKATKCMCDWGGEISVETAPEIGDFVS